MSPRSIALDAGLHAYVVAAGTPEHPALAALRHETAALENGGMQSSIEQMQLLRLLIECTGAIHILEVGCFTGYGSLAMALALPDDGRLVTLEADERWPAIGRPYWREAGVEAKIDLRIGLAEQSLEAMSGERFDLAYIDADKKRYGVYLDHALRLVRPGGLIALDNMLWKGAVTDPDDDTRQTTALRAVARHVAEDPALTSCLVPIGDGVMLARRRGAPGSPASAPP
ncbi:MAG: class I SAM-dependent methyltransferase [Geminicoccaceae bacterium]|nr:class I SAM-dependent methyltransferase [Geminicoccaceae bacterium]